VWLFIHSVSVVRCFARSLVGDRRALSWFWLGLLSFWWESLNAAICSETVLHLEDAVREGRVQMGIGDLLDAEAVEHLVVRLRLQALELVNGDLAVVDRDKVDQLLVVVDVNVELLDGRRVRVNIFRDRGL